MGGPGLEGSLQLWLLPCQGPGFQSLPNTLTPFTAPFYPLQGGLSDVSTLFTHSSALSGRHPDAPALFLSHLLQGGLLDALA